MYRLKNYLNLIRFFHPIGTLLLLHPVLISFIWLDFLSYLDFKTVILFIVGTFLMRSAGCVINDLCDYKFDKKVMRTKNRPLASGMISKIEAFVVLFFLLGIALLILLQFNYKAVLCGLFLIIPIILYPFTKRFFRYPQIFLGMVFNAGIFLVWLALEEKITTITVLLYVACVFWTIGYDTIYAHQDIDDDIVLGLNSTAISFGDYNGRAMMFCYMMFFVLLLIAGILKGYGFIYFILLNALAVYSFMKLLMLNLENKNSCAKFFKFNNIIGLSLVIISIVSEIIYF